MHYELTDETITVDGRTLHRIRALKDLPEHGVKKGDLGGFIEHENNLVGDAWVGGNAQVFGAALVSGKAHVFGKARVSDRALVSDEAQVFGKAQVCDEANVLDAAQVFGEILLI